MSDPATSPRPSARPVWADVRLILGIALVVASIGGVWLVVTMSRHTEPVFAAVRTLVPGDPITSADVRVVEVGLGAASDSYLTGGELAPGLVATRTIGEGELLAVGAVGAEADTRTTHVVVRSAVDVPASVGPGSVVEVWHAPLAEPGAYDTPRILLPDAVVVSVDRGDSTIGGPDIALEIVIARSDVAATLAAMSDGAALSVVPTSGAVR